MNVTGKIGGVSVACVVTLLWAVGLPHDPISGYVGTHFPWPIDRSWKWIALLTEGAIVEILATVPIGVLLPVALPEAGVWLAVLLSGIFALRVYHDGQSIFGGMYVIPYLFFHVLTHFVFLVGTAEFGRRQWRGDSTSRPGVTV